MNQQIFTTVHCDGQFNVIEWVHNQFLAVINTTKTIHHCLSGAGCFIGGACLIWTLPEGGLFQREHLFERGNILRIYGISSPCLSLELMAFLHTCHISMPDLNIWWSLNVNLLFGESRHLATLGTTQEHNLVPLWFWFHMWCRIYIRAAQDL